MVSNDLLSGAVDQAKGYHDASSVCPRITVHSSRFAQTILTLA
jgi:hypothetical protein